MNQEQNNMNLNNFNTQGNNGLLNNQPLQNNQNLNTTYTQQPSANNNMYQQSTNQININTVNNQQSISSQSQEIINQFSSSFKNENINNNTSKSNKKVLVIVSLVILMFVVSLVVLNIIKNINSSKMNVEVIYFDVKSGMSCTKEKYESSWDEVRQDYLNSLTGYNGIDNSTGNQNNCLKFYVINDDKDKLSLILDHNTTASVEWNSTKSNIDGPIEVLAQLQNDTMNWKGTITPNNYSIEQSGGAEYEIDYSGYKARLITADEVAKITGNSSWDEKTSNTIFYFDSLTTNPSETCYYEYDSSIKKYVSDISGCSYGWLYDRTYTECENYGCLNNTDIKTYGFWTSSSSNLRTIDAWYVACYGYLRSYDVYGNNGVGVRPVIEVSKSNLS